MKIAISSTGPFLNDQIDARFGRCGYFIIIDSETMAHEAVPNENVSSTRGAGISAALLLVNQRVDVVLTGNLGPKAANVFDAVGIRFITGVSGIVGDAVKRFTDSGDVAQHTSRGQMQAAPETGASDQGFDMVIRGRRDMGGSRQNGGGGRRMGMGRGRCMGGRGSMHSGRF